MCLNPKLIKRSGEYKEDNYRGQKGDKYSIETFSKCGCCTQCIAEKANNWVVRNHYEALAHSAKCFITLTYAKNPMFLVRKDCTDFIKRFRYEINKEYLENFKKFKKSIKNEPDKKELIELWKMEHEQEYIKTKIFYAGEYGTIKGRPHYHLIVYGWEDNSAKYVRINKKINIVYESEVINKCWGLGITSYQDFGENEASYVALYNTAQATFKNSYKISLEKTKKMRIFVEKNWNYYPAKQRGNLLKALNEFENQLIEEKKRYLAIKEFNGWSLSMGWEEFFDEYAKTDKYVFTAYIKDMQFPIPSPWLKKLANKYGDIKAAEELFKREKDMVKSKTVAEEIAKNNAKENEKRKKEKMNWAETGKNTEIGEL